MLAKSAVLVQLLEKIQAVQAQKSLAAELDALAKLRSEHEEALATLRKEAEAPEKQRSDHAACKQKQRSDNATWRLKQRSGRAERKQGPPKTWARTG